MATNQAMPASLEPGHDDALPLSPQLLRELRKALRTIRFGAVELFGAEALAKRVWRPA